MDSSATPSPIQRRLVLVRHSKAVEEDAGGDHARGLNARGAGDAITLGKWLVEHGVQPDLILCSTAARARDTLTGMGIYAPTILSEKLYLTSPEEMLAQIQAVEASVRTLMVVGHNPSIHALLGLLVGSYAQAEDADRLLLKFPTSACAVLSATLGNWRELAPQAARLERLKQ